MILRLMAALAALIVAIAIVAAMAMSPRPVTCDAGERLIHGCGTER